jgi:hypothetical protein
MESISLLRRVRAGCRQVLLAGLVAFAIPTAVQAAPTRSCDPFCGILRFMTPLPHRATAVAARRTPLRIPHVVAASKPLPRIIYAGVPAAPRVYARPFLPRYVHWPVVYPAYGYPGYGYVYYYAYPVYR